MTATLPARILIQIRNGVPNTLAVFDLEIAKTTPIEQPSADGAILGHEADIFSMITGLARAQRKLLHEHREQCSSPAEIDKGDAWFLKLAEWVIAE